MANPIVAAMKRKAGSVSGKVLTEVAGSALALVAVTAVSGQMRNAPPAESGPAPAYRPTLDPITGKIVDRLAPGASATGGRAVASFVAAPGFVALASLAPWSEPAQRADAPESSRAHAVVAALAAAAPRQSTAEIVPLPPARPATLRVAANPLPPAVPGGEPRQGRFEQAVAWLAPDRVVEGGAQVFAQSRDTIYRAVAYGGDALSRIYR